MHNGKLSKWCGVFLHCIAQKILYNTSFSCHYNSILAMICVCTGRHFQNEMRFECCANVLFTVSVHYATSSDDFS